MLMDNPLDVEDCYLACARRCRPLCRSGSGLEASGTVWPRCEAMDPESGHSYIEADPAV